MKKLLFIFSITFLLIIISVDARSQCAMCRRVAETGHENDSSKGRGLNHGILYLLSVPYILGGVGAFVWYRNRRNER